MNSKFNFLEYCRSIENLLKAYYAHSKTGPTHRGNLGDVREHFISNTLKKVLPETIHVGTGEITDGRSQSNQQDIVVYRSDFPIFRYGGINIYLAEGVLATIEIKSNFVNGKPNEFTKALQNVKSVQGLNTNFRGFSNNLAHLNILRKTQAIGTFVIAYNGWSSLDTFVEKYVKTIESLGSLSIPTAVYQPAFSAFPNGVIRNDIIDDNDKNISLAQDEILVGFIKQNSFAFFLQALLKVIFMRLPLTATMPGNSSLLVYDLDKYFNLPKTLIERSVTLKTDFSVEQKL